MSAAGSEDIVEIWHNNRTRNEEPSKRDTFLYPNYLNHLGEDNIVARYSSRINNCDLLPCNTEEIMRFGYPSHENVLEKYGYVLSFNKHRKVPNWVCEYFTADQLKQKCQEYFSRKNYKNFFEDPDLNPAERATIEDFKNSGYARGHLAAAANHLYNINAYKSTYCLSNIVPMHTNVNAIIEKFETRARKLAINKGKVYSCTGTIFYESVPTFIKPGSDVQVPDAIFKVIVYENKDSDFKYTLQSFQVMNLPDLDSSFDIENNVKTFKRRLRAINFDTELNILGAVNMNEVKDVLHGRPRNFGR